MMDYALPKADMLPFYETDRTETPTPVNPWGQGRGGDRHHRLDAGGGQRGRGRPGAARDQTTSKRCRLTRGSAGLDDSIQAAKSDE